MENSRFARKCNKDGGYFKCCLSRWYLNPYEETRNQLIKDKLIKDEPTHICDKTATKDPCYFCSANAMCTKHNPLNNTSTNSFYPGMKKRSKSKHKMFQDSKIKKISWDQTLLIDPITFRNKLGLSYAKLRASLDLFGLN